MVTRIGSKKPSQLFLREWRKHRELTQDKLAARLSEKTTKSIISKWENGKRSPGDRALAALAEALSTTKDGLFRHPDRPSIDELLKTLPEPKQREIVDVVKLLISQAS